MGQNQTVFFMVDNKPDVVFDVFSQALIQASHKVKGYLGFKDPQQKLRVCTRTLNEVFLVTFINFCKEQGLEDRISTSKMSRQQEILMGVDWVWTLTGTSKSSRFQIAVQTVQLVDSYKPSEMDEDPYQRILERSILELDDMNRTRYQKLLDFCSSVGPNCTGLILVYGLPGKLKEIRGVLSRHLLNFSGRRPHLNDTTLLQYLKVTESFITIKEMMHSYLCNAKKASETEHVYITFL
ncbi:hypothetical protein FKM82_016750 [Ascaphus truei]